MEFRRLGSTGVSVSKLCLGAMIVRVNNASFFRAVTLEAPMDEWLDIRDRTLAVNLVAEANELQNVIRPAPELRSQTTAPEPGEGVLPGDGWQRLGGPAIRPGGRQRRP